MRFGDRLLGIARHGERGSRRAGVDGADRRSHERAPRHLRPGRDPLPAPDARRGALRDEGETPVGLAGDVDLSVLRGVDRTIPLEQEWQAVAAGGHAVSDSSRDVTVKLDDSGSGMAVLLDDATARIVELETRGYRSADPERARRGLRSGSRMSTHGTFERGVPLIVLGLTLVRPSRGEPPFDRGRRARHGEQPFPLASRVGPLVATSGSTASIRRPARPGTAEAQVRQAFENLRRDPRRGGRLAGRRRTGARHAHRPCAPGPCQRALARALPRIPGRGRPGTPPSASCRRLAVPADRLRVRRAGISSLYERDCFLIGGARSSPRGDGTLHVICPSTERPSALSRSPPRRTSTTRSRPPRCVRRRPVAADGGR